MLSIRDARPSDATFLAMTVMAGMHCFDFETEIPEDGAMFGSLTESEGTPGWLDSYEHCRIAELDGTAVGAIQSFPGDAYRELRRKSFRAHWPQYMQMEEASDQEADPGEYFIDSLAVIPACRRQGIGRALLMDAIRKGAALGYRQVSITVDSDMPQLIRYYASLGFVPADHRNTFGVDFLRMLYAIANPL